MRSSPIVFSPIPLKPCDRSLARSSITGITTTMALGVILCALSVHVFVGCFSSSRTVALKEGLRLFDALIPVDPDSILELYDREDRATFNQRFFPELAAVRSYLDSLNEHLPPTLRIDTLAIDHAPDNFGNAARSGKTIFISSSYFFLYRNTSVLRAVVAHEYGHIYYERLPKVDVRTLDSIWADMRSAALFYLFRDGEYAGNARFGGHPNESPEELFASAFNIFHNNHGELLARLQYVDPSHHSIVYRLQNLIFAVTRR
jgi:hypothetical protein